MPTYTFEATWTETCSYSSSVTIEADSFDEAERRANDRIYDNQESHDSETNDDMEMNCESRNDECAHCETQYQDNGDPDCACRECDDCGETFDGRNGHELCVYCRDSGDCRDSEEEEEEETQKLPDGPKLPNVKSPIVKMKLNLPEWL